MSSKFFIKVVSLVTTCLLTQITGAQTTVINNRQNRKVHQLGLQVNPYLNENLFQGFSPVLVFGIRYAYYVTTHLSLGPEVNGFAPIHLSSGDNLNYFRLGAGVFTRYSFFTESRVRVFAEFMPYYSYRYWEENQWLPELRESRLGISLNPGISLYSKSRRFSVDLYMKFSNIDFVNSKNYVFSYKVNYHF